MFLPRDEFSRKYEEQRRDAHHFPTDLVPVAADGADDGDGGGSGDTKKKSYSGSYWNEA